MISVDTPEDNKKFAEMHGADYPILSDVSKEIANSYGVLGPTGLARRWTFYIGPDGKILYIDKEVKPATSGADIAARLGALNVAKKK
jgi:thioredoxin-dependent peroxiredoxin